MTRRSVKNVLHRIQNLPRGANLLRYLANKGRLLALHLSRSANVAYPPTIMFEVTNHCQLKCVTCPREYAFGKQMDKGFMDFERFKAVMDEASPYLDSVGLTGLGETFLYQDLPLSRQAGEAVVLPLPHGLLIKAATVPVKTNPAYILYHSLFRGLLSHHQALL